MSYNSDMLYHYLNKCKLSFAQQTDNSLSSCLLALRKSFAFTLAEVLITLAIIGVVAAMTIPTLIAKHKEQVIVNKLNATYSLLSQATTAMVNDLGGGGPVNVWGEFPVQTYTELLPKYLKVSSELKAEHVYHFYILPNGAKLRFRLDAQAGDTYVRCFGTNADFLAGKYSTYYNPCGKIDVIFPPYNKIKDGVNIFQFSLTTNGVLPQGYAKASVWTEEFSECLKPVPTNFGNCSAWVIYNKNMDYLHCPEKLGWDKKHSCND